MPRDRKSEFEPQVLRKNQAGIGQDIKEKLLSMYAKDMTTSDIEAHILNIYDVEVSDATVSPYYGSSQKMAAAAAGERLRSGFHGYHPLPCPQRRADREERQSTPQSMRLLHRMLWTPFPNAGTRNTRRSPSPGGTTGPT